MKILSLLVLIILSSCSTPNVTYQEKITRSELKFCLMGDTGNGEASQLAVAQALKFENCDRIFILGDIIYPEGIKNSDDPLLHKNFLNVYKDIAQSGSRPQFSMIMGNHDYRGSVKAWKEVAKQNPWVFYPYEYYLQKINDTCFLALDSNLYTKAGHLKQAYRQMKWLASLEKDLKSCRYKIALAHHPYLSPERSADGFLKQFYEEKVIGQTNMLITGHDHFLKNVGNIKGTQLIISGAGGQFEKRPGFLVIKISDKLRYQFKEVLWDQDRTASGKAGL